MIPKIFGAEHIVFLIIICAIGIASICLIKKFCKTDKQITLAIRIYSAVLFVFIVFNRITIAINRQNVVQFLPNTFCGITSLSLAIFGLFCKKDSKVLHCLVYCGLLGGVLTMIYPDFLGQLDPSGNATTFFYPATFSGLMHHSIMFFFCLTIIITKFMTPTIKKWAYLPIGLCFMMVWGQFCISCLGFGNAMYINEPVLDGTFLTWYTTGAIFLALVYASLFVLELVRRHKAKKFATASADADTLLKDDAKEEDTQKN